MATVDMVDFDLQAMLDALPFYVLLVDEDHRIIMANKALGLPLEKIIGQYCPKIVHGLNVPFPGCPLEEALATGRPVSKELYDERSDRWLESSIFPLPFKTKQGKKIYYHQVFDISDRKTARQKLEERTKELEEFHNLAVGRELKMIDMERDLKRLKDIEGQQRIEQELFAKIADGIADGVLLISRDYKILWANAAILKQYGCGLNDVVGKTCYELTHNRPEPCAEPFDVCPLAEVERTGQPKTARHTHFRDNGERFEIDVTAYPLFNRFGEITEYVHLSHEVG